MQILIFMIEGRRYAVDLNSIERSLLAVECTTIPNSPEYVLGAINVHGEIIPVINMREILELKSKEMALTDQLILCTVHGKRAALAVDHVIQVIECEDVLRGGEALQCVMKKNEEITLLCDLERLVPEHSLSIG